MMNQSLNANNLNTKPARITVHGFSMMSVIQPGKFLLKWAIENTQVTKIILR